MSIKDIKKMQSEKGFTIVELLIVIVVIGILAAIVIVAYNGITQQANGTKAKANADGVLKVAETFNAECPTTGCSSLSGFPTLANLNTYSGTSGVTAKLPTGLTLTSSALPTSANADGKTIFYNNKGTTGACVAYWDQKANAVGYLYSGDATAVATTSPFTCS